MNLIGKNSIIHSQDLEVETVFKVLEINFTAHSCIKREMHFEQKNAEESIFSATNLKIPANHFAQNTLVGGKLFPPNLPKVECPGTIQLPFIGILHITRQSQHVVILQIQRLTHRIP